MRNSQVEISQIQHSPLQPLSYRSVQINDAFWSPRVQIVLNQTIPYQYEQCEETGRLEAFKLNWKPGMDKQPHFFWDSDVAKWLEAASYSLGLQADPELDQLVDNVIDLIVSAQQPDGYLNTYFTVVEPEKRWLDLRDGHELYCAGHLIEAAVAHYEATGKRKLLDAMIRYVDHIDSLFGDEPGKKRGYCGHEEIELALVKLYRLTGEERFLRLSTFFINERGQTPNYYDLEAAERGTPNLFDEHNGRVGIHDVKIHTQSHLPVREQTEAVGHAVRAMYLYAGMADLAAENGDASLTEACQRLWHNVTAKRMYVTGGVGTSSHNEGFTRDYDLPNESAYCETCAAIGLMLWGHRMLALDCNARYSDTIERALYNGIISGMSLDGKAFFYDNPLASNGDKHRKEWFGCSCCPPNIARLLTSLGSYIYSSDNRTAAVHLYVQSEGSFTLQSGEVSLRQETNYPWDSAVKLTVGTASDISFALKLRIPGWCPQARIFVNGTEWPAEEWQLVNGYAVIDRVWSDSDVIHLDLAMPIRRAYSHPNVHANAGRVALTRGPLVYCIEQTDHEADVAVIGLPGDAKLQSRHDASLLGGVTVLEGSAVAMEQGDWQDDLYRSEPPAWRNEPFTAIPYYAWDNREDGSMRVWILEA
ncbi:hypothetical protein MU1_52790 [Paenibacillus glycanilyticus]|uniref:Glycoside hydrolase family 127 protein n=1 Tax=Paenibacillus glycanilyticus TaxID=126569 RepID=A0ABQ6GNK7_9BACL|nr:hypothetical protein MU1_52790 [Paenibacillus glycanilyticus]